MTSGFAQLALLLRSLSVLTGVNCIWKVSRNCLMEMRLPIPQTCHHLRFCESVKDVHGIDSCVRNDTETIPQLVAERHTPFVYRCHAGAVEFVVPVLHADGQPIGMLLVGPFLPEEGDLSEYSGAERLPRWHPELAEPIEVIAQNAIFPLVAKLYSQSDESPLKEGGDKRIQEILYFINHNFHRDITMEEAAREVYLSPSRLSHLFKKECGTSFSSYLLEIRIRQARELLDQTDLSIYEIARRCGFSNQNYFSAIFTRKIGFSPTEYRRHRSFPSV